MLNDTSYVLRIGPNPQLLILFFFFLRIFAIFVEDLRCDLTNLISSQLLECGRIKLEDSICN